MLGPDVPAVYEIPKESEDPFVHGRQFPIVSDEELLGIWEEYFNQVIEYAEKARRKYG